MAARLFAPVVACSTVVMVVPAAIKAQQMPLWRDEVSTITIAHRSLGDTLAVLWDFEGNGAVYYVLMNGWTRLGTGELWVRVPTIAFMAAAVVATALLARRLFGHRVACIVAPLLALNFSVVELATEARAYAPMLLLAVVSTHLLVAAVERGERNAWLRYAAVAALMAYAGILTMLVVLAHAVSLVALPRERLPTRDAWPAAALFAIGVAPVAVFVLLHNRGQTSWIEDPRPSDFTHLWTRWLGGPGPAAVCALAVVVAAVAAVRLARDHGRTERLWHNALVGTWLLLPPVLVMAISLLLQPLWQPRYVIWSLPPVLLAVALGIDRLGRPRLVAAAGAVLVAFFAVDLARDFDRLKKAEDLRAAARFVHRHARAGDAIAYTPAFARLGFDYYYRDEAVARPARDVAADARFAGPRHGDEFVTESPPGVVYRRVCAQRRLWIVGYPGADWHPTPEPFLEAQRAGATAGLEPAGSWTWGQFHVGLFERGRAAGGRTCAPQ